MPYISAHSYRRLCNYQIVGYDKAEEYYDSLRLNPKSPIAYDIETEDSGYTTEDAREDLVSTVITQIQFATDKYNAIVFPRFDTQYKDLSIAIMKLPNPKLGFNSWSFDNPIMHKNGMDFSERNSHDLMQMFKHWHPKLPRGLQVVAGMMGFPFPWKHLFGMDMETYGGADVCSLFFIMDVLPRLMKARGVWQGYIEYVYKFRNRVLQPAADLGLPVNDVEREKLKVKLIGMRDGLDRRLQDLIPIELKNVKQKKKIKVKDDETGKEFEYTQYGYKREPAKEIATAREKYDYLSKLLIEKGRQPKSFDSFLADKYQLVQGRFKDFDFTTGKEIEVVKWYRYVPFKASFDQLSRYIKWKQTELLGEVNEKKIKINELRKNSTKDERSREIYETEKKKLEEFKDLADEYVVPKNHEGKETTNKKELEIFLDKTADEVVQCCLEIRSLGTNINNYVPNWKPTKDGCVHTTFGFSAASGQIDSRRPNVLNVSKHTPIGQLFRRIIEAPKGYTFLEFDKKSFHVATMGYACNDATYIRFSQLDPHSIFTSYIMPREWGKPITLDMEDGEILERSKWIKKRCKEEKEKRGDRGIDLRQDQAKPTVLGNQLGLGPRKLYWMNRRSIEDENRAKYLQAILAELFPKVEQGKREIRQKAHKQTYLMNEFGYIQHFFEVYKYVWNKKKNGGFGGWDERENDEARDAIAFAVQSPAFGMIKDECFRILARWKYTHSENCNINRFRYPTEMICNCPVPHFPFRLSIHDSLGFIVQESLADELEQICKEEMSKPCAKLINEATGPEGLKVGVEGTRGRNWMSYDKETNPEGMK